MHTETSDRDATLLTCLINTIRRGSGLAGRYDGDVVVTGNLFKGGSSFKVDQPFYPLNMYTQESLACLASTYSSHREEYGSKTNMEGDCQRERDYERDTGDPRF